jgi:membrane fusion protein (multidrug efflux system)
VSVGSADAQLAAARAARLRAEADARKAALDFERAQKLKAANAIPQQQLDNAQAANDEAVAALAQAKANIAVAEESRRAAEQRVGEARGRLSQTSPIEAQIAAAHANADLAHARVTSAEAQLELARLQLSYTNVTAPADGIASKLSVHEGQLVAFGSPVIELVPTQTYVIANFKETQLSRMKPGQRVVVKIDAYPGKRFEGKVESLSGGTGASFALLPADNATGNFVKVVQRVPVRIAWSKPPELPLRAGLSVDVTVHVGD